MNSIKLVDRRVGSVVIAFALLLAFIAPSLAFAAQVTARSIAVSNSSKAATGVNYQVNFTAVAAAGAFVVDFCSNSPVIGQTCTAPAGFTAATAASTTSGFTDVTGATSKVTVAGAITAAQNVSVTLNNITNPAAAGPLYARIVTYDTKANALTYTSADLKTGSVDEGGVAISITDTVAVSGAVLETMTFCVSGDAIKVNCDVVGNRPPVLKLGEPVGDATALTTEQVSTGNIYTQISTNASNGAIISLKSNATDCGGLKRAGAPTACNILPALKTGLVAGDAKFGVRTGAVTDTGTNPNGVLQPFATSGYNTSTYTLNYASGNTSGVTSSFGDPFLDTDGAPINNKNMGLTFGASVNNSTPAGLYSADISLIATGKY